MGLPILIEAIRMLGMEYPRLKMKYFGIVMLIILYMRS